MEGNGFRVAYCKDGEPFQGTALLPPENQSREKAKKPQNELRVKLAEFETPCDGCGNQIYAGDKIVAGIDSCCGGGCWRRLCMKCVHSIIEELINGEQTIDIG